MVLFEIIADEKYQYLILIKPQVQYNWFDSHFLLKNKFNRRIFAEKLISLKF